MDSPTKEDYDELEQKHAALEEENKTMKSAMDEMKKGEDEKTKDMQAKLQAMEEDKKDRDEKEKHEMATKIANKMVESEEIKEANISEKIKELQLQDAKTLQAMLPFAESTAKKHLEAKQALAGRTSKPRYELSEEERETEIKQAADSKSYLASYRSGFY